MIQLRVRTEYSFRKCYGPIPVVAERIAELGCAAAGIVDRNGTWGHVQWEKAMPEGIIPLYGREFGQRWVLAEDLRAFYRLSSNPPEDWSSVAGVVRFAAAGDPETFDYIDINPRSRRRTLQALALAKHTGKPLVATSDNDYPGPEHLNRFLAWDDSRKMTPQHIASEQELRAAMWYVPEDVMDSAVRNTHEVLERIGHLKLNVAPIISVDGDLGQLVERGKQYRLERGHIGQWTQEYEDRLQRELALIKQKQYESYFIVVADMVCWAKERMLVGPARGSSAGSLVCYLTRITEVDPLKHNLIFERFIDVNRDDLPDIDVDFNDQRRGEVFEYLAQKYGEDNVARIGSVNRLKPRSVIAHVGKKLRIPHGAAFNVLNVLIEYSSGDSRYGNGLQDTLTGTQPGIDFMERYPEASLMGDLELHASHTGQHAAGVIVSNEPVNEYCTVSDGIAQVDKKDAEHLNLLKIDALGLRTLGVIEDTGCVKPQQLFDLPLDDKNVLDVFNEHKYSGLFQFEGAAQRRVAMQLAIDSFERVDHVTALARPGPLGGGATGHYISRANGDEPVEYRHPSMQPYLSDTLGLVLYQEQVMRIVREIGGFSWEDTSVIRKAMSGRKGKEFFDRHGDRFVEGAAKLDIPEQEARDIWESICSFGAWGMNKSHTVSYAIISYWCAYMKRYHHIEYAAACLRHAKDDEQTVEILRELRDEGTTFIPFDPQRSEQNWSAKDGELVGGFTNLVGIGPVKAQHYVLKRQQEGLSQADLNKLAKHKVKHDDLTPAHTKWGHLYDNPDLMNVHGRIRQFGELRDGDNACVICRLVRQERRDENEAVRANKRGYLKPGQTLFLDMFVVDDSVSKPVIVRVRPQNWRKLGLKIADNAVPGKDWFLVRGRWLDQFSMMIADKVKCLTNKEMFL